MAAERFEDRHRELRAQAAGRLAGPSAIPLVRFNRATSGLVDDLVAAVREALAFQSEYDPISRHAHRGLNVPLQAVADRLAALDEASGRG